MIGKDLKYSKIQDLIKLEEESLNSILGDIKVVNIQDIEKMYKDLNLGIKSRNLKLKLRNEIAVIADEYINTDIIHNIGISLQDIRKYLVKGIEVEILKIDKEINKLKDDINSLII